MTDNMMMLESQIKVYIDNTYRDKLPTEDQIFMAADQLREALKMLFPVSDEEFAELKRQLPALIVHSIG